MPALIFAAAMRVEHIYGVSLLRTADAWEPRMMRRPTCVPPRIFYRFGFLGGRAITKSFSASRTASLASTRTIADSCLFPTSPVFVSWEEVSDGSAPAGGPLASSLLPGIRVSCCYGKATSSYTIRTALRDKAFCPLTMNIKANDFFVGQRLFSSGVRI
jgi:hypothetical protein